jgi:hypothetical protein
MDSAVSLLATGAEDDLTLGSHPPNQMRREVAWRTLVDIVGKDYAEKAIDLGRLIQEILALLWRETRNLLHDLHEQGYRPAPKWTASSVKGTAT